MVSLDGQAQACLSMSNEQHQDSNHYILLTSHYQTIKSLKIVRF